MLVAPWYIARGMTRECALIRAGWLAVMAAMSNKQKLCPTEEHCLINELFAVGLHTVLPHMSGRT